MSALIRVSNVYKSRLTDVLGGVDGAEDGAEDGTDDGTDDCTGFEPVVPSETVTVALPLEK